MSKTESDTLFAAIARDRPEWLAQGIFAYALAEDAGVRRFVLRRALPSRARVLAAIPPAVERERPYGHWRADVVAKWKESGDLLWFELKLGAGLTARQAQELPEKDAVIVHPFGRRPVGLDGLTHIAWSELAVAARDPVLKTLLAQVDASSSWWHEVLTEELLHSEFESFLRKEAWEHMYRFLATVDAHLKDLLGPQYRPSRGWAMSRRKSDQYYGYAFHVGGQRKTWFFVGFSRDNGGVHASLTFNPGESTILAVRRFPLRARTFAAQIAANLAKRRRVAA